MQWSVETRVPFLDPGLVALALNLPLEQRVGPEPKGVLRDVAHAYLPARVVRRPKQVGLGSSARGRLFSGTRPEFLADGCLRDVLGLTGAHWQDLTPRLLDHNPVALWTTEIWCRLMLDGESPEAVEPRCGKRLRVGRPPG